MRTNIIPLHQITTRRRAARLVDTDLARIELHYLASILRTAEQNMKRVSRPPFRMRSVTTLVYSLYGRHVVENLGLTFENYNC